MLTITTSQGQTLMEFDRTNKTYFYNDAVAPNRYVFFGLRKIATPPYAGYQGRTVTRLPELQGPNASAQSYIAYWYALKYYYAHVLSKGNYEMFESFPVLKVNENKKATPIAEK